jgi:predicted dehydrogenase
VAGYQTAHTEADQHQRNFEEVVNAIREGRETTVSAAEARKPVAVIRAIYESAQNGGKRVEL